jgi:hypothetical protein
MQLIQEMTAPPVMFVISVLGSMPVFYSAARLLSSRLAHPRAAILALMASLAVLMALLLQSAVVYVASSAAVSVNDVDRIVILSICEAFFTGTCMVLLAFSATADRKSEEHHGG